MYVFGPAYRNPFITTPSQPDGADISRNAIEFKHVDAWKYGHNLVEVIIKKSSDVEPAAGGGDGAMGLYAIFRSGVGINRIAGRPVVALGPLRDIDIQAGMNLETKNSDYAPAGAHAVLRAEPPVPLRRGVPERRPPAPQGVEPQRQPGEERELRRRRQHRAGLALPVPHRRRAAGVRRLRRLQHAEGQGRRRPRHARRSSSRGRS